MKNRESWVDYAKAIGIILVVYGHVARGLYNGGIEFPELYFKILDSIVYSFHMPLFFFLSGLFFYQSFSKKGFSQFVFSKIDTVFYPYVIWSILQGSIEFLLSNYTNGDLSLSEVFSLLWSPRAQFWFLYTLFAIFFLSSVVYSFISKRLTIILLLCTAVMYLYPPVMPSGFIFDFIGNNFFFFVAGIAFTQYAQSKQLSDWKAITGLALLFVIGQWFFHGYLSYRYTDRGVESLVLACIGILLVISISSRLSRMNGRYLIYIGSSSMAIYLMHILAGSGARVILDKVLGIDSVVIHLIIGCLFGLGLPLICLYLLNRLKVKYVLSAPVSLMLSNFSHKFMSK